MSDPVEEAVERLGAWNPYVKQAEHQQDIRTVLQALTEAQKAVEQEREECAKLIESGANGVKDGDGPMEAFARGVLDAAAKAIRARK